MGLAKLGQRDGDLQLDSIIDITLENIKYLKIK